MWWGGWPSYIGASGGARGSESWLSLPYEDRTSVGNECDCGAPKIFTSKDGYVASGKYDTS